MKEKCGNCRFWKYHRTEHLKEVPPRTIVYGTCRGTFPVIPADTKWNYGYFPIITEDLWCGKWEKRSPFDVEICDVEEGQPGPRDIEIAKEG